MGSMASNDMIKTHDLTLMIKSVLMDVMPKMDNPQCIANNCTVCLCLSNLAMWNEASLLLKEDSSQIFF